MPETGCSIPSEVWLVQCRAKQLRLLIWFLMPSIALTFFAAISHCWLMFNLWSTKTPWNVPHMLSFILYLCLWFFLGGGDGGQGGNYMQDFYICWTFFMLVYSPPNQSCQGHFESCHLSAFPYPDCVICRFDKYFLSNDRHLGHLWKCRTIQGPRQSPVALNNSRLTWSHLLARVWNGCSFSSEPTSPPSCFHVINREILGQIFCWNLGTLCP